MPRGRFLLLVARDQPVLWWYLTQDFARFKGVEVVLDQRRRQRRQGTGTHQMERREFDRRRQPGIDRELRRRSFVIVARQGVAE